MNNNEPPQKNPQNWEKQAFLTLFKQCQTHQNKPFNIKTSKKQTPKKHHFAMFKNNPLFFMNFLFFQHRVFVFEKLWFAENTIKIVFSGNTAFQKHS